MRAGIYCTADVDEATDEILGVHEDTYDWTSVSQAEDEIQAADDVARHCRVFGQSHIKYLAIVTTTGKVHHHIAK